MEDGDKMSAKTRMLDCLGLLPIMAVTILHFDFEQGILCSGIIYCSTETNLEDV